MILVKYQFIENIYKIQSETFQHLYTIIYTYQFFGF